MTFLELPGYPIDQTHELTGSPSNGTLQAGYQVGVAGGLSCTLGFTAIRKSTLENVWVTASHCSATPRSLDYGSAGQPYSSPSVGSEIADPPSWGCKLGSQCRNSDASMYSATRTIDLGRIARTTTSSGCEDCEAGLAVDHSSPTIVISGRREVSIENEILHKIGKKTGWTYGAVEDTCGDYYTSGWWKLCSDRVDYSSGAGDSGAPVFKYSAGQAELRGIHFAYWPWPFSDGVMSRLSQIEEDLGELAVFDPGPPTVSIAGPTSVRTGVLCTWTASVSNGIDPYSYDWTGLWAGTYSNVSGVAASSGWLNLQVTDLLGRTASTMQYITVTPDGPVPPGCTEE